MILAPVLLSFALETPPADAVPWRKDIPQALAHAEEQGAPLLILFNATPCGRYILPGETDHLGRRVQGDYINDCDRMEVDVWSHASVREKASRFVPVLTTLRTLNDRYHVATTPTAILADPWGNEIVRLVGYTPRNAVERILGAIPRDFRPASEAARAARDNPQDIEALVQLAHFYEKAALPEFAGRYYDRALATDAARKDGGQRRPLVIARGTNLLLLGKAAEAAALFRADAENSEAPEGDAVLFGWLVAELQQGRRKDAERAFRDLLRLHPESRYLAKAKEHLGKPES